MLAKNARSGKRRETRRSQKKTKRRKVREEKCGARGGKGGNAFRSRIRIYAALRYHASPNAPFTGPL